MEIKKAMNELESKLKTTGGVVANFIREHEDILTLAAVLYLGWKLVKFLFKDED